MKKILNKINLNKISFSNAENIKDNMTNLIPYFLPENWSSYKKTYILFWSIASFTIIFFIWAAFAEINQVVRAGGVVRPDSKVHLIQTAIAGPVEEINISLGDEIQAGDILFVVDQKSSIDLYNLSKSEVETRSRKVEIIEELVERGSDSEFRLLDENLALIEAQKRLDAAKRKKEFSNIRTPISGSISKVNVTNIGQIVKDGGLLAEVVPEDDILKIEAGVASKDIAYVKVGQKARISFTAFDVAIYGQVDGVVTKIAANTTENEDGGSFYPAIIEVDSASIKENQNISIQSGMQCDVAIIGEERTVLSYITNPITKLSLRALQE